MATNVDEALYSFLSSDAALTAIIGTRAFAGLLPEFPSFPALTWQTVADESVGYSHEGASGLRRTRYQFSCWGQTYTDARSLARALITALDGLKTVVGGYTLGACFLASAMTFKDPNENLFVAHIDFYIWNAG